MKDKDEVRDIRDAMREFLRGEGLRDLDDLLHIKERWKDIAGEETASFSRPYRLEAGRLYVGVESHARVQDALFRKEEIRRGIREVLGMEIAEVVVKKVNLK
ncbi:MAG: DUF721 domain-containing protein [Actinomycetota bacterium]|nr:DUF721 domain-containing protein [Actinomycetota bacterium]MDD5667148.1 DUF721 domain-containing protein [Actinomycetota bacterium]